jgi:hypothetical protein
MALFFMLRRRFQAKDALAALALLALNLTVYGQLLSPHWMLADYDAFVYFYPLRAYAAAAVQDGGVPFWNPSSLLGAPFVANPQVAFFYPFTPIFYWLSVPHAYGISLALHALLAGLAFYAFCRLTLRVGPPAALVGGAAFMLGGVLSGQYGHLNQISAVAWLPLVLLAAHQAILRGGVRLGAAAGGLVGVQLLAGHPQQSYMTVVAMAIVCLWTALPYGKRGLVRGGAVLVLATALGAGIAAIQLLPSLELAGESIRGDGLTYREAIADSLWPWLVARALLPGFVNDLGSTEFLGYVGVVPLLLAAVALGAADSRRLALLVSLALLGLALALGGANPLYQWLYGVVPGFGSFRTPARWLLLYSVGVAGLAAVGLDWLLRQPGWHLERSQWRRLIGTSLVLFSVGLAIYLGGVRAARWLQLTWLSLFTVGFLLAVGCAWPRFRQPSLVALLVVVAIELWFAGADLAPRTPIPMEAYAQPRDTTLFIQSRLGGGRFLSVASEEYELKETPDYRERYSELSEQALTGFLVAAKRNEILTPNINLLYRIDDVDGYDGGLLPLRSFLRLASLLVPPERLRSDGALITRMESLPDTRLMDLLNLRIVLAGRSADVEDEGVEYDRAILKTLRPGERLQLRRVPSRAYTAVGLLSSLEGQMPEDGTLVARLEVSPADGPVLVMPLIAGRDTALTRSEGAAVAPTLKVLQPAADSDRKEYLVRIPVPMMPLSSLTLENLSSATLLHVRAISLIDEAGETFTSLVLDDRIERAVFFDHKVYEYPGVLPRAYLVHRAIEADDDAGLALLASPDFSTASSAVVEPGAVLSLEPNDGRADAVDVVQTRPDLVRLRTSSSTNALLVLSDALYPGWRVSVDGQAARLIRTNVALRGVAVPVGQHDVVFTYEPDSLRWGAAVSALAVMLMVVVLLFPRRLV